MMELAMTNEPDLSPLRRVLCSHANAVRVAHWMRRQGIDTAIVATCDPLQPWLIVDAATASEDTRACA